MSSTIEVFFQVDQQTNESVLLGDKVNPLLPLIANGQVFQLNDVVVADGYTALVLWAAPAGFPDYSWGVILSDKDLLIERKSSLGTAEYVLDEIKANVPYIFGYKIRGGTTARITTTVNTTGLGNTIQITVQNNQAAAVGSATVNLLLFR